MHTASAYFAPAIAVVLAYLIGGLPFGYWLVRWAFGKDIRTMGSGNIGATNVHRTQGWKAGIIVLALDIAKGLVAVWIAALLTRGWLAAVALSAVAVMLGHCYPLFLRFKGGKAVACFIGAFLYLAPLALACSAVVFLAAVAWSGYISLGSVTGALLFPVAVWLVNGTHPARSILGASVLAALLIVYRHRANLSRLRKGTEPKFSLRGGRT